MNKFKGFPEHKAQILDALAAKILNDWQSMHACIPDVLYHYTTADGLLGIINSRSFWMTNLRYMNDLSEVQYAEELIRNVLAERAAQYTSSEIVSQFFIRISNTFSPFTHGLDVFATSFCEDGNLLSQWRAYGDRGGGYALGLDFFHLLRFLSKRCALRKVIYRKEQQIAIISEVVDQFCSTISQLTEHQSIALADSDNTLPSLCQQFNNIMGEFIFCLKHPDFEQEQEWRLVHACSCDFVQNREDPFTELQFRTYGGNVIPYFSVSFSNSIEASRDDTYGLQFPIVELVIGPTISPELNMQSVKMLLSKLNPDFSPNIKKSGIPLRWL